ncbi:MerC domain-containing protein [Putridiphycobacter roseus]|uniref:MerC domain-containing protein n=1 Tax=Putridiphycobacter roseus TaxID=2219161 RepID=A0A2W1MZT0_9FLAO|nr:MerC domain-containing protein [Putridiphycobacter roseus]
MINIGKMKADTIGIFAGTLCLVHCVATPFIFIAKACASTCCSAAPTWWKWIDYLFIVVSFIAIYYATKNSNKRWIQIALWGAWTVLLFTIINEAIVMLVLPESFIYYPALSIVALHLYNRRYCTCQEDKCCAN